MSLKRFLENKLFGGDRMERSIKVSDYRGVGIYLISDSYYAIRNNLGFVKYYSIKFITEDDVVLFVDNVLD